MRARRNTWGPGDSLGNLLVLSSYIVEVIENYRNWNRQSLYCAKSSRLGFRSLYQTYIHIHAYIHMYIHK